MKKSQYILVPDNMTTGLWCSGSWVCINGKGHVGCHDEGYPMTPDEKKKLVKYTRLALKQAQKTVVDLSAGLERLRIAPTKNW